MPSNLVFSLTALAALLPAAALSLRPREGRYAVYWAAMLLAVAGPAVWSFVQLAGAWRTALSTALWVTIAASMAVFAVIAARAREAWRLAALLLPYLALLGLLATLWQGAPGRPLAEPRSTAWLEAHILLAVASYALINIAAAAGLAVFLQERALKNKRPNRLTRLLPPIADAERIETALLVCSTVILAIGLVAGIALNRAETGQWLRLDHKTLLSLLGFAVVALALIGRFAGSLRGRRAARWVLFAWVLLTLAYPGVKFVRDVLLG
jgi:ABC-type uncharacterized transport system permease subunit